MRRNQRFQFPPEDQEERFDNLVQLQHSPHKKASKHSKVETLAKGLKEAKEH